MSKELSFALSIARQAGDVALEYYRRGIDAVMKSDNTPVTAADRQCERLIREAIAREFPDDDILGEEEGETKRSLTATAARKWIIDPIDGTYNYARQVPIFSTLLALEVHGQIVAGVVHAPAMGDTFWAEKGCGAYKNGRRIFVSDIDDIERSQFVFGAPIRILEEGFWGGLERIVRVTYRQRAFGDYLNFGQVFEGKAEAVLEIGVKPWDLAPMKVIAEEAGGRYADLQGGSSVYTGSCLVSNGILHEQFLKLLGTH